MKKTIIALVASGALLIAAGSAFAGGPAPVAHFHPGSSTHTRVHESINVHFGFGPRHGRPCHRGWGWHRAGWRCHHGYWRHHRYY